MVSTINVTGFCFSGKKNFIERGKKKDDIISSINFFLYINNYM